MPTSVPWGAHAPRVLVSVTRRNVCVNQLMRAAGDRCSSAPDNSSDNAPTFDHAAHKYPATLSKRALHLVQQFRMVGQIIDRDFGFGHRCRPCRLNFYSIIFACVLLPANRSRFSVAGSIGQSPEHGAGVRTEAQIQSES